MAKRAKAKVNLPIIIAAILLCLTLFSIHLTSGVYARYTATASGSDSARVIKFGKIELTEYGADSQPIIPGTELTWGAAVSFTGSESATYVFLEIDPSIGWAVADDKMSFALYSDGPAWTVSGDWTHVSGTVNPYVYYLPLAPNETLDKKSIFVSDTAAVPDTLTAEALNALSTLSAKFRASVVQSNGFDSPADAWSSLDANH